MEFRVDDGIFIGLEATAGDVSRAETTSIATLYCVTGLSGRGSLAEEVT